MPKSRPPYPAEFRKQIVELALAGRTPAELAREFGCTAQTVANWVAVAGGSAGAKARPAAGALSNAERDELARLRRENRQLRMEREILGKATAWFAARSDKTFTPSSNS